MRALVPTLALTLAACDASSRPGGLYGDDAGGADSGALVVVRADARVDRPTPSCGGMSTALTRRRVTAMLVIDRSGSMADATTDGYQKWMSLVAALRETLPRVDDAIDLGLVLFPRQDLGGGVCDVGSASDLAPAPHRAAAVLAALEGSFPAGATPTYAALDVAARRLLEAPDRSGELALIVATDGAPNCNLALDREACRCTSPFGRPCTDPAPELGGINCLDGDRAVAYVSALRAMRGVSTYVIGLNGVQDFGDVLDAMAAAGGHPRTTPPRYYSANTAAELVQEFQRVTSALADCRWQLDQSPPDPALVDVRFDGRSVYFDAMHRDGWDWVDDSHTALRFYGPTCAELLAASGGSRVVAAFGCPAPTPP